MTVRGSQSEKPAELEFGKDTVYERQNIRRIEEDGQDGGEGFVGWEYDEQKYSYPEYVAVLESRRQSEAMDMKLAMAELAENLIGGQNND